MENTENVETDLGLSEDFSKFTVLRDDSELGDVVDDKDVVNDDTEQSEENEDEDNDTFFDLSTFSEEEQKVLGPAYKKMQVAFTKKMQSIADLEKKAQLADILLERRDAGVSEENPSGEEQKKSQKKLLDYSEFGFQENDYYAPSFKKLADAINSISESIESGLSSIKKETTVNRIKTFFENNPSAIKYMKKMDEIGRETPGLYNNLPRLLKLAKLESGETIGPVKKSKRDVTVPRTKSPGIKRMVENKNLGGGGKSEPKIETIKDAWKLAEEQLTEE